jgi:hypothetical protein
MEGNTKLIVPILVDEGSDGDEVQNSIVRMKTTSIGQYLAEKRELLPLNRKALKIITMLMEFKKTTDLAKQGNKGYSGKT